MQIGKPRDNWRKLPKESPKNLRLNFLHFLRTFCPLFCQKWKWNAHRVKEIKICNPQLFLVLTFARYHHLLWSANPFLFAVLCITSLAFTGYCLPPRKSPYLARSSYCTKSEKIFIKMHVLFNRRFERSNLRNKDVSQDWQDDLDLLHCRLAMVYSSNGGKKRKSRRVPEAIPPLARSVAVAICTPSCLLPLASSLAILLAWPH